MKKIGKTFLIALLLDILSANAAIVGVTGNITRIGTGWNGDGLYLSINQSITTSCPGSYMIFMPVSAPQYRETVSIALSAQAQNKPITIYYDNATCPRGDIPTFIAVGL